MRIIDDVFDREETLGLIAMADAYVSLHRSEGLGLTMAEAMLLGKPVIATGYSGNLDFMNDRNSLLVTHKMVAVGQNCPPYEAGLCWAEPSIDDAARLMRRLYENRDFGKELGTRARADLGPELMYANAGKRMAERLAEIAYSRRNVV